jgi:hypothetical protein
MKRILLFLLAFTTSFSFAQSDKTILKNIKKSIQYLADDKLEGRRTGTAGEKLAFDFIAKQFEINHLEKINANEGYIQPFEVNEGIMLTKENFLSFANNTFELNEDYFPMPFSQNVNTSAWGRAVKFYDVNELISENKDNPHFDLEEELYVKVKNLTENPIISLLILFNSTDTVINYSFDTKSKKSPLKCPIIYCNNKTIERLKENNQNNPIKSFIEIVPNKKTGHNVMGMINNHAPLTVVIGAHYDHLGYGEDHNSLYTGKTPMIHNGADDNASGSAALIALTKMLKENKYNTFNYLFIAFSGEELGLYGSKYAVEHLPISISTINYMVNMDMVGRLNDSTHGLTIGGFGTSLVWGNLINIKDDYFKIKVDSAGIGPSDHTSFYKKELPVLFFFTGTHSDYHKPSDDADKINYTGEVKIINYIADLILKTSSMGKINFTKTKDAAPGGKSSFKVTLGIMPDYTFSGNGVLVDGVSDNRPAQKAGILTGDVIIQLGDFMVSDVQTYMTALNKFKKGDAVVVKIKRGAVELLMNAVF